ncbi:MAG TPA: hypothetical protein VM120_07195 [Bryobacteraceae bacterium]|nr:hypothetical protein [Bryobacteraceae bacterium]
MVEVALAVNRSAALQWLGENYGAPGEFADDDRREQAARARGAELAATWRRARIRDLEQTKAAAAECLGLPGDEDERAAAWVHFISTSRELHAVEHLEGDLLRMALNAELRARTAETAAMMYDQREWEAGAVDLAAWIAAALGFSEIRSTDAA